MSDMRHDPRAAFIDAATWHGSLERAEAILAAHPELASSDIHTAAVLGDDAALRRFLERDQANATAKSDPYGGEPPLSLCLPEYPPPRPARAEALPRAG